MQCLPVTRLTHHCRVTGDRDPQGGGDVQDPVATIMTWAVCRHMAAALARGPRVQPRASARASPPVRALQTTLRPGQTASSTRRVTETDLRVFSALCGDSNPVHSRGLLVGQAAPEGTDGPGRAERRALVHGAFLNALASGVIGSHLPGAGTIVVGQNLRFPRPCLVGDEVTTVVEVTSVRKIVEVTYRCIVDAASADPKVVLEGNAKLVMAAIGGDDHESEAEES